MRVRSAWVALACVSLVACAAIERTQPTARQLADDGVAQSVGQRALFDASVDRLARRASVRGDRTVDILVLSGGGQHGAYGIGFLRGWQARGDAPMPVFDMVTGVSTGALQAPFALLGTPADLRASAELYRGAADQFAPTPDLLFWLRRTGGVVDTRRFRTAIATAFDRAMVERLQAAGADGRQLLVATSDFDLGVGRVWDVIAEASRAGGIARAQDILVASSAIPGIFPPILIDGHVHADGGVVSNALFPFGLAHFHRLATRLRELRVTSPVRVRVWVVMNLWTHAAELTVDPSRVNQIRQRSSLLMLWGQQPQLLERLDLLARAVNAEVPGVTMSVQFTAVPARLASEEGADKLFDAAWMQRLERIGYERAQSADAWDRIVSPYERP